MAIAWQKVENLISSDLSLIESITRLKIKLTLTLTTQVTALLEGMGNLGWVTCILLLLLRILLTYVFVVVVEHG